MPKEKLKPNWYIENIISSLLFLSTIIYKILKDTINFTNVIFSTILIIIFFVLVSWILYKYLRNSIKNKL